MPNENDANASKIKVTKLCYNWDIINEVKRRLGSDSVTQHNPIYSSIGDRKQWAAHLIFLSQFTNHNRQGNI